MSAHTVCLCIKYKFSRRILFSAIYILFLTFKVVSFPICFLREWFRLAAIGGSATVMVPTSNDGDEDGRFNLPTEISIKSA
jgi:hypothetical protein